MRGGSPVHDRYRHPVSRTDRRYRSPVRTGDRARSGDRTDTGDRAGVPVTGRARTGDRRYPVRPRYRSGRRRRDDRKAIRRARAAPSASTVADTHGSRRGGFGQAAYRAVPRRWAPASPHRTPAPDRRRARGHAPEERAARPPAACLFTLASRSGYDQQEISGNTNGVALPAPSTELRRPVPGRAGSPRQRPVALLCVTATTNEDSHRRGGNPVRRRCGTAPQARWPRYRSPGASRTGHRYRLSVAPVRPGAARTGDRAAPVPVTGRAPVPGRYRTRRSWTGPVPATGCPAHPVGEAHRVPRV